MSFLASLSPEARDELRAFVQDAVRQELAARDHADARQEWLTTAEAAKLLGTSENAIRCRVRRALNVYTRVQGDAAARLERMRKALDA